RDDRFRGRARRAAAEARLRKRTWAAPDGATHESETRLTAGISGSCYRGRAPRRARRARWRWSGRPAVQDERDETFTPSELVVPVTDGQRRRGRDQHCGGRQNDERPGTNET